MYARVVLAQTKHRDLIFDVRSIFLDHVRSEIDTNTTVVGMNVAVEESGTMMSMVTYWSSREACVMYQASDRYRRFLETVEPLLVGSLVVKSAVRIETMDDDTRLTLHKAGLERLEQNPALELAISKLLAATD